MPIGNRTAEFERLLGQQPEAKAIGNMWERWDQARAKDMALKHEVRSYVFATDTTTTTNNQNDWRHKTTTPKLCQIRDNLHANYMANMFSSADWLVWEPGNRDAASLKKRRAIEAYTRAKLEEMEFRTLMSRLVYDFIDYGNVFAGVEWVAQTNTEQDGTVSTPYVGPRAYRISPEDIVMDPTAASFEQTPVIIRSLKSMGDFEKELIQTQGGGYEPAKIDELREKRRAIKGMAGDKSFARYRGIQIDGFGSITEYFTSGMIEILEFIGDYYDSDEGKLYENHIITVADRCTVLRKVPNPTWGGRKLIVHAGWRLRPDNLWAMGPLDNLVGLQYRIDHLENLKADAGDMSLFPPTIVKGWVEDFEWRPRERINVGDEGSVETAYMPVQLAQIDSMIAYYMNLMEEMAGAPREAAGFRSPGEKTKYEVQSLERAANRIFQAKTSYMEEVFVERLVNLFVLVARQMFRGKEVSRSKNQEFGTVEFLTVTRDDLLSKGLFRAVGARHHAEFATKVQNLTQFANSPLGQDPGIRAHVSNKVLAKVMEHWLGLEHYGLVQDGIGLAEAAELQQLQQSLTQPQQSDTIAPQEQGAVQ